MERIKIGTEKEFELIVCGIKADEKQITLKFLPGEDSLDSINTLLTDPEATAKMTLLSESGDELAIYNGYTSLLSISQEMNAVIGYKQDPEQTPVEGKLVTAVMAKPDQTEQRIASLEDTVDTLAMEILGM